MKKFLKIMFAVTAIVCLTVMSSELAHAAGGVSLAFSGGVGNRADKVWNLLNNKFNFKTEYDPNGKVVSKVSKDNKYIIEPSYLRIDAAYSNNSGAFNFNILGGAGGAPNTPIEKILNINDLFVAHSLAFPIIAQTSAAIGREVLQFYPNQNVFVPAALFTPADLDLTYNGQFQWTVQQKVNISGDSMYPYRYVPQTQQVGATDYSQFEVDKSWQPSRVMFLHGRQQNTLGVAVPTPYAVAWANTNVLFTNKLCFYPLGFLIKSASAVADRVD
jgi:hypothetical protein